jgi:hypothetical protein
MGGYWLVHADHRSIFASNPKARLARRNLYLGELPCKQSQGANQVAAGCLKVGQC